MRKAIVVSSFVALVLIGLGLILYGRMSPVMPAFRGTMVEKNVFWAIRIPLINAITLLAFAVLVRSIARVKPRVEVVQVGWVFLGLIMTKMIVEFVGLFNADFLRRQIYVLVPLLGIAAVIVALKYPALRASGFWTRAKLDRVESALLIAALVAYVGLNVPAFLAAVH